MAGPDLTVRFNAEDTWAGACCGRTLSASQSLEDL